MPNDQTLSLSLEMLDSKNRDEKYLMLHCFSIYWQSRILFSKIFYILL